MKKIKKALSVILCALMVFTMCVPAFAAENSSPPKEEKAAQNTEAIPDVENPDGEGEETDIPDSENPEDINPDEVLTEDDEDTYLEVLEHCLSEATHNITVGAILMGAAVCSPVLTLVFYPIGVAAALGGLPLGALSLFAGIGEIVASPIIALFVDTDTSLTLI